MIPLPDFVDAVWLARRVQASPRSLRLIHEAADEIRAQSGLDKWPAELKTERDFAELFLRGFVLDPDFSRYCARAAGSQYDNRNKQSPTFFRRAALDAKIRGAKLLGGDAGKLDFFATLEELAEKNHGEIASELAFLMLAEGGFSSRAARIIEGGGAAFGALGDTVKAMKRADILRGLREKGVAGEQGEAFINYREAQEQIAETAAHGEPSREALAQAARTLARAADALAQWECASYTPRAPQAEVAALRAALETMAPILNAQGAQALHERGAKSERALAACAARVLPRGFYGGLEKAVAAAADAARRAGAKLDRARAIMKSGDLSKMDEIKTANEEAAALAAEALDGIDAIAEKIQAEKSVPSGKSAEDLRAEIGAEIGAAFAGGDAPAPKPPSSSTKARRARKKQEPPEGESGGESGEDAPPSGEASAEWAANTAGKDILALMAAGDYGRAQVAARAAVEAFGEDRAPFSEAELALAAAAQNPDPARADDLELAAMAAEEALAKNGVGGDDGGNGVARRLSLFSAALAAWPITGGDSAAGRILHDLSIDKEFNEAAWPLKEALGAAVRGGLFAIAENSPPSESAPMESAADIEKRVRADIEQLGAKRLNFTLGQQVQRELLGADGEIGALLKALDAGGDAAAAAARKFAHDYGGHADAKRLVDHAVERTPGSHSVEGRARNWFVTSIEKIAGDCAALADAAGGGDTGADWLSQMRRNLGKAADAADAALQSLAERAPDAAAFAAQCREHIVRLRR